MTEAKKKEFKILFQNEEVVVISKPSDVAMDGDRPEGEVTVERWVATDLADFMKQPLPQGLLKLKSRGHQGPTHKELKFVHQLDLATSGVLCLAFSKDMAASLAHAFQMRTTKKHYLALVSGWLHFLPCGSGEGALNTGDVTLPVGYDGADPRNFRMKVCSVDQGGKEAATHIEVLQKGYVRRSCDNKIVKATKVLLAPKTGRRHQLRIHCLSLGHPIIEDGTYNSPELSGPPVDEAEVAERSASLPTADRMMLHAWKLWLDDDYVNQTGSSNPERVRAKKKRRRETLGLIEATVTSYAKFEAPDPISQYFFACEDESEEKKLTK